LTLRRATLYVNAFTHEGTSYIHRIFHALNSPTGGGAFSPVLVSAAFPAWALAATIGGQVVIQPPNNSNQRFALTLAGGKLYAAYAGYGDTDPYHGWIIRLRRRHPSATHQLCFQLHPQRHNQCVWIHAGRQGSGCLAADVVDANTNLTSKRNGVFNATNGSGGNRIRLQLRQLSTHWLGRSRLFHSLEPECIGGGQPIPTWLQWLRAFADQRDPFRICWWVAARKAKSI